MRSRVMGGCKKLKLFFGGFRLFLGERTRNFALFLYVTEEAGRKCVRDMPWPLSGRMQYDYKQTN